MRAAKLPAQYDNVVQIHSLMKASFFFSVLCHPECSIEIRYWSLLSSCCSSVWCVRFPDHTNSLAVSRFLSRRSILRFFLMPRPACVSQVGLNFLWFFILLVRHFVGGLLLGEGIMEVRRLIQVWWCTLVPACPCQIRVLKNATYLYKQNQPSSCDLNVIIWRPSRIFVTFQPQMCILHWPRKGHVGAYYWMFRASRFLL